MLYRNRFLAAVATTWIFFILIALNLLPNGLETPYLGVTVSASPQDLLTVIGFSDSGNYLRGAIDLQDLAIGEDNIWIFNLWPPGQMLLLAIVIKFGFPPVFSLMIIFAFLWSVIGAAIFLKASSTKIWYALVPCVLILWFTDSPFVGWNQSVGVLGSDGIGAATLCLLYIYLSNLWKKVCEGTAFNPWMSGFIVSAILSFLSHLRVIFLFSIVFSLALIVFKKVLELGGQRISKPHGRSLSLNPFRVHLNRKTTLLLTILIVFSVSLTPFTIVHFQNTGSISWASGGDYQWAQRWMTDEYLTKNNAGFLVDGGANWACEIDPVECKVIQKSEFGTQNPYSGFNSYDFPKFRNLAFLSIFHNPVGFLENRITLIGKSFTSDAGAPVGSNGNLLRGFIFLLIYLYLVIKGFIKLRRLDEFELFTLLMLVGLLAPLLVAHFETRYLIPVQALSLVVFTFNIASFNSKVKST